MHAAAILKRGIHRVCIAARRRSAASRFLFFYKTDSSLSCLTRFRVVHVAPLICGMLIISSEGSRSRSLPPCLALGSGARRSSEESHGIPTSNHEVHRDHLRTSVRPSKKGLERRVPGFHWLLRISNDTVAHTVNLARALTSRDRCSVDQVRH